MTKLPIDWPPLYLASVVQAVQLFSVPNWGEDPAYTLWDDLTGPSRDKVIDHQASILGNLTIPVSRDWAARLLGSLVGLPQAATAPGWYRDDGQAWRLHANGIWFIFSSPGVETTCGGEKRILVPGISETDDPAEALCLALLFLVPYAHVD